MATTDLKKAADTSAAATSPSTRDIAINKSLDYSDLKPVWGKLIDKKRPGAESGLLRITTRISKLDPIAEQALVAVKAAFNTSEANVRKLITRKGWATEVDRVTKRLNGLRISDNKRVILALVYPHLLNSLLSCNDAEKEVKDDIGFADSVLFELERENGPLDKFAEEVVKLVGAKHRINFTEDNVLRDLIAHQVRAGL